MANKPQSPEELGASFRQSKRELFVMVGTWIVFVIWVLTACALNSGTDSAEPVELILGMPSWVFYGIALPWLVADVWILWFALRFMKDTPLVDADETN